jgi:hypothetical protein
METRVEYDPKARDTGRGPDAPSVPRQAEVFKEKDAVDPAMPAEIEGQSSIQTSEELNELLPALIVARLAMPEFQTNTDGQTGNQTYRYAPLPLVLKSSVPHLGANDMVIIQAPQILGSTIYLDTKIYHKSGQWIGCELHVKLDTTLTGERAAKEIGKAITYMRRYALLPLICVAADRDDYDSAPARNGGNGDPRRQPSAAPPRDERPPKNISELTTEGKKLVEDLKTQIEVIASGDEQKARDITKRITRFKPQGKDATWFEGYNDVASIKKDRMANMATHNLGELINGDIGLDDPMT